MPYVNGILGRLASNPELVATKKGGYMCNFIVANDCGYGEHKQTDFVRCVAFNKTGETISRYFKKGDAIIVQGEMHNRPYQKNDKGYDIPNWQYTVNSVVFLPRAKQSAVDDFVEGSVANAVQATPAGYEEVNSDNLPF